MPLTYKSKASERDERMLWLNEASKKLKECMPAIDAVAYNAEKHDLSLWKDSGLELLEEYRDVLDGCLRVASQMSGRLSALRDLLCEHSVHLNACIESRKGNVNEEDDEDDA